MDERTLLTCLVRTLSPGQGIKLQISSTVVNRLTRLLSPLSWNDYEPRFGTLAQFISSHPELFVMDGPDLVSLREGAHAIIASLTSRPPSFPSVPTPPFSTAPATRLPDVSIAVTPVAAAPAGSVQPVPSGAHSMAGGTYQFPGGSAGQPGLPGGAPVGVTGGSAMAPPGLGPPGLAASRAPAPHSYYNRQHGNTRGPIGQNYTKRSYAPGYTPEQDGRENPVPSPVDAQYSLYGNGHYAGN